MNRHRDSTFRRFVALALAMAFNFLLAVPAMAAVDPVNTGLFGSVAVQGYDMVAYFLDGKPIEGKKEHGFAWRGATWRFASAEHRDLFAKEPEKYAPQYGGYCAWAVSQGYTANVDPEAWKVVAGKLYLNYDKQIQAKWEADTEKNIRSADQNWPKLQSGN